jgi:TolB-like protein
VGDARQKRNSLLHELKRRGVVHVAGLYLVAAWVIVQVADVVSQGPFPMPQDAMRSIWIALILIFPLALAFGWRYDITRQGILRSDSSAGADRDLPLKPVDHAVIATLSLVVAGILGMTTIKILEAVEHERLRAGIGVEVMDEPAPPNSIAVLPFSVCAGEYIDEALAAALATEVINRLATRGIYKVIARASSFTMAGFGLPLPQIAEPLGVKYLLTGVVCRSGETLTLSVELVHEDGFVVWADSFEQAADPSGNVRVTLATLVADGVGIALGNALPAEQKSPVNRLAHEQLLIGYEHARRDDNDKARQAFEKALEYQPDYADAVFSLAVLDSQTGTHMTIGSDIEESWPRGQQALEMARGEVERGTADFRTHLLTGQILYTLGRWERGLIWRHAGEMTPTETAARKEAATARIAEAEHHFRTAIALNPSEIQTYTWLAYSLERQGLQRRTEALEIFEQGLQMDPFNADLNRNVAKRWAGRGDYRQAMELLERFDSLPDPGQTWWVRLEIMKTQTYWDEKCQLLLEILQRDPAAFEDVGLYGHLVWLPSELAWLGLREEAEAWYERVEKIPRQGWGAVLREWFLSEYLYAMGRGDEDLQKQMARLSAMSDQEILDAQYGEAGRLAWDLALTGEYERAIRLNESIRHNISGGPFWAERNVVPQLTLAELYQKVGRDADAVEILEEVLDWLEMEYDSGIRHPDTLAYLAETYARLGRDDEAINMLRKAVDYHYRLIDIEEQIRVHSPWQRIRDDPRFIAQKERIQGDLDQQARRVRAMLAEHDVDALVGPVIEMAEEKLAAESQVR